MTVFALPQAHHETDDDNPSGVMRVCRVLRPTSRGKLIGNHESLRTIVAQIERVAHSQCNVLVTGESGTGKELVVAALHDASTRALGPLVVVNCGAIPENLLESELFGHSKGAFTGAHSSRLGRVAAAQGGTLFLDEVGELPLALQVKLLRLLQQREYSPVGDSRVIKCDIRIVAATNRNLEEEVAKGRFREDLFYRLNVMHVNLPPLRERRDDIPLLAQHFLEKYSEPGAGDIRISGFAPAALDLLVAYDWPGNIRALENAVERAVLLAPGPLVEVDDLPPKVRMNERVGASIIPSARPVLPETGLDLRESIEQYENMLISQALERTGFNKNRAAQLLGINRTTLVEMVKRKGLSKCGPIRHSA